jgi:hypothetical protein
MPVCTAYSCNVDAGENQLKRSMPDQAMPEVLKALKQASTSTTAWSCSPGQLYARSGRHASHGIARAESGFRNRVNRCCLAI